jgi:OPA family glycerol-3-phosphate transporter-like MFS transporter
MVTSTGLTKSALSIALTGCSVAYGAGQLISGYFGDKIQPKRLISIGLLTSVLMNLSIPLCTNPAQMLVVWCINGFAQAFMWPPIVKIMVEVFSEEYYKKMAVRISWASSYGTIAIYLIAPLIITLLNWRFVFLFSSICGVITIFLWNKYSVDIDRTKKVSAPQPNSKNANYLLLTPVVIGIMIAIILQGMLRDGVTTWMPTYIADVYHLDTAVSILTGIVMPLFSIGCTQITSKLYRHKIKSPVTCSVIMFVIGTTVSTILYFCSSGSAIVSILCSAILTGAMHGVSSMLTAMVPPFFKKYGNVSTVTGVLNACAYVGSGISTFGIAIISENYGWQINILIWCLIAVLGTIICFACIKPWKRKFQM